MQITRKSMFTGKEHTMEVPCTAAQLQAWQSGMFIQDAMPNVSPELREFLMTGVTPDEWNEAFGEN